MYKFTYKVSGSDLEKYQADRFSTFYEYLIKNPKRIKLIYRGENYSNLKDKLNLNNDTDYNKLNHFVFLIGEKGRVYREKYKTKIKNKNKLHSIDSIENKLFNIIFKKLNILLSKSTKPEVTAFKTINTEFSKYFKNKINKQDFINKINLVFKDSEKLRIRDYYLSLLHTIGTIGFYNNSFFTSSSTSYDKAKKFTKNSNNSEKIIFVSWIKYPLYNIGISFNYLNLIKPILFKFGFPTYKQSFFPAQNEISVKGGILPHFILGYIRVEDDIFEINPNFFFTTKNFDEIVSDGFDIDQSSFTQELNKTNYSGFFILNENNEYSDVNY